MKSERDKNSEPISFSLPTRVIIPGFVIRIDSTNLRIAFFGNRGRGFANTSLIEVHELRMLVIPMRSANLLQVLASQAHTHTHTPSKYSGIARVLSRTFIRTFISTNIRWTNLRKVCPENRHDSRAAPSNYNTISATLAFELREPKLLRCGEYWCQNDNDNAESEHKKR